MTRLIGERDRVVSRKEGFFQNAFIEITGWTELYVDDDVDYERIHGVVVILIMLTCIKLFFVNTL